MWLNPRLGDITIPEIHVATSSCIMAGVGSAPAQFKWSYIASEVSGGVMMGYVLHFKQATMPL